ncbi:MAG: hypothetical protein ACR2MO_09805 [Acidimicrobiales bacterium]
MVGCLLLVLDVTIVGLLIRWVLRPVDRESKARLDERRESMRWRNIFKR